MRLATAIAGVGLVLASMPMVGVGVSSSASNTATTLVPSTTVPSWRRAPCSTAIARPAAATSPSGLTGGQATG